MPSFELTQKQKDALKPEIRTLTAGAGSGKTAVLTRRYSESIKSENEVQRVIAFTFTNKAANEMRSRVVEYVLNRMRDAGTDEEYKGWWER